MEELSAALGERRIILPRLTGVEAYAPCETRTGGEDDLIPDMICAGDGESDLARLTALADLGLRIHDEVSRGPTARNLYWAGRWQLLFPEETRYLDSAVALFEASLALDSTVADVHSDLAAALLVRAGENDDPVDLVAALSHAMTATDLDSTSHHIVYNAALAYEGLFLDAESDGWWRRVAEVYGHGEWGAEADSAFVRLAAREPLAPWEEVKPGFVAAVEAGDGAAVEEMVRRRPRRVREYLLREAFPAWARVIETGDPVARAEALDAAVQVADVWRSVTGDELMSDATQTLASSRTEADRARLVRGHVALADGLASFDRLSLSEARGHFDRANAILDSAGSALSVWAAYGRVVVAYAFVHADGGNYESALNAADRVLSRLQSYRYSSVAGLTSYVRGLMLAIRGDFSKSTEAYVTATRQLGASDFDSRVAALAGAAFAADQLGAYGSAWRYRFEALRLRYVLEDSAYRFQLLTDVATAIDQRIFARVALLFHNANVAEARGAESPAILYQALAERGRAVGTYDIAAAQTDFEEALSQVDRISAEPTRRGMRGNVMLLQGEITRFSEPKRSLAFLREALKGFRGSDRAIMLVRTHLAAAEAHRGLTQYDSARGHFEQALVEIERQRNLVAAPQRSSFFDGLRPVFDSVLAVQVALHESPEALFDFVESVRARVLLERAGRLDSDRPVLARELRDLLSPDVSLVSFAVIGSRVITSVAQRDTVRMMSLDIPEFDSLVVRVNQLGDLSQEDFAAAMTDLYDALLRPVRDWILDASRLVFVPDRWIHLVPFAALISPEGRLLVEDHDVVVTPSASIYVSGQDRDNPRDWTPKTVLAVGNPASDPAAHAFGNLPFAEREAKSVAGIYGAGGRTLIGPAATRDSFVALTQQRDVIHLATHAVVDKKDPMRSFVLLADGSGSGVLTVTDIEKLDLQETRLVLLSACRTAGGFVSPTEGPTSLARSFMTAGASGVIATMWPVPDAATADFALAFHRRLRDGLGAEFALGATQREWSAQRPSEWRTWAAFQFIGRVSPPRDQSPAATR